MPQAIAPVEILDWSSNLNVGIDVIDMEHTTLVALANQLAHTINRQGVPKVAHDVLAALGSHLVSHFRNEEELMRSIGHPLHEEHVAAHRSIERQILGLSHAFERTGEQRCLKAVHTVMAHWLRTHVTRLDTEIAVFPAARKLVFHMGN